MSCSEDSALLGLTCLHPQSSAQSPHPRFLRAVRLPVNPMNPWGLYFHFFLAGHNFLLVRKTSLSRALNQFQGVPHIPQLRRNSSMMS